MKLKQIIKSYQALNKIASLNFVQLGLDHNDAKRLITLKKEVNEEIEVFERLNKELAETCGLIESKIQSGTFEINEKDPEYMEKIGNYQAENTKMQNEEIEFEYKKIDIKKDYNKLSLSTNDIIELELFFNFGE